MASTKPAAGTFTSVKSPLLQRAAGKVMINVEPGPEAFLTVVFLQRARPVLEAKIALSYSGFYVARSLIQAAVKTTNRGEAGRFIKRMCAWWLPRAATSKRK